MCRIDEEDTRALVAEVIARNPDRRIQAAAYQASIAHNEMLVAFADEFKNTKYRQATEESLGKSYVIEQLARAEKAKIELDRLEKTLHSNYGDLVSDLSIGNAAPEIKIQDLDGKGASLFALKGKVVVLDIWATWCPPCRAMIPHEREMVERLKDKPFALVSISVDEKKKTLTEFLAKEQMPWTHWWNGSDGGVIEEWDVRYYPTIYVIDAQGVIRHKDLRGEELEKAVNALLEEAAKTGGPVRKGSRSEHQAPAPRTELRVRDLGRATRACRWNIRVSSQSRWKRKPLKHLNRR